MCEGLVVVRARSLIELMESSGPGSGSASVEQLRGASPFPPSWNNELAIGIDFAELCHRVGQICNQGQSIPTRAWPQLGASSSSFDLGFERFEVSTGTATLDQSNKVRHGKVGRKRLSQSHFEALQD